MLPARSSSEIVREASATWATDGMLLGRAVAIIMSVGFVVERQADVAQPFLQASGFHNRRLLCETHNHSDGLRGSGRGDGLRRVLHWWNVNYYVTERDEHRRARRRPANSSTTSSPTSVPPSTTSLFDSRPLGGWELNASAAVIRLDCPMLNP